MFVAVREELAEIEEVRRVDPVTLPLRIRVPERVELSETVSLLEVERELVPKIELESPAVSVLRVETTRLEETEAVS